MDKKNYAYSTLNNAALANELKTSLENGLSDKEAVERLKTAGPNELICEHAHSWQILLRQLKSPFIYLLIAAAGLAFLLGETLDGLFILLFILINSSLGFYQEFKSEQALHLLQQYTKSMTKVTRGGKRNIIKSSNLVPGDLVILETGAIVPADIRLIENKNLTIDETTLTGESGAVYKNGLALKSEPKNIYDAKNLVFTSTTVINGSGQGVVVATGQGTAFGQIKKLTTEIVKESIFAKGITKFSSFILKLIIVTLVFVFLANIAIKGENTNIIELIIFSIALAVSVIPEALPVVTTLSLSRGALKLAKQKVITKRLSAIEDLGGIEILCTDKTGTLTENKLTISEMLPSPDQSNLLLFAHLGGAYYNKSSEPFDVAIRESLSKKTQARDYEYLAECPFDPKRRRNSVLVEDSQGNTTLIVRGAPEEIMALCTKYRH